VADDEVIKVPTVAAILRSTDGRILLQQRDYAPGISFPGYWTLPGGRVEEGESPEQAIERELWEELEFVPSLALWKIYERQHQGVANVVIVQYVYFAETDRTAESLAGNEGLGLRYFDGHELAAIPIGFDFLPLLTEFCSLHSEGRR